MATHIITATQNVRDCVHSAIGYAPAESKALVVFDAGSLLAQLLTDAYRAVLPDAQFIPFESTSPEDILARLTALEPRDLVILVQSTNFRLNDFRLRIELFKRHLAVIEHVHLARAANDEQIGLYIDSLAYDASYYRTFGAHVKARLDGADKISVHCEGTELRYAGGMEPAKLNVGDYSNTPNVGGTFPIGEVFTEPRDFSQLNGEAKIFAFAGNDHRIRIVEPFKITIKEGILVGNEGPTDFQELMTQISEHESVMVREFGVGLNRAFGKDRVYDDITAFERQHGLHISLGEKHGLYKKPGLHPRHTRYHIDVFVDVQRIDIDGTDLVL